MEFGIMNRLKMLQDEISKWANALVHPNRFGGREFWFQRTAAPIADRSKRDSWLTPVETVHQTSVQATGRMPLSHVLAHNVVPQGE